MSSIALVDFGSLWGLAWHGHGENELNGAQRYVIRRVLGWADHYDHVAICLDSPPYRRKQIYADYKAQREKRTDLEREQFKNTVAELQAKGFCLLAHAGEEADDVIASAAAAMPPGHQIDVLSADKDLTALSGAGVRVISPATNEEIDPVAKWGIEPARVPHALAMAGDTSDNVPGIEGVASGRAATLLRAGLDVPGLIALVNEKAWREGTREQQIANISARLPPKMGPKIAAGILDAVANGVLQRAFELVQLRGDLPIDVEAILAERKPAEAEAPASEAPASDESWDPPEKHSGPPSAPPSTPEATFEPMQVTKSRAASVAAIADRAGSAAMVVSSGEWTRALEPAHLGGAWKLAKALNDAALFRDFGSPSKVLSLILAGRELGIGAMASLRGFHLVEGKPCMSAQLMMGLCLRHPDCEYFRPVHKDCTNEQARVIGKRKSWPEGDEWTWEIEEARRAGLSFTTKKGGPGMWSKYPKNMLIWRCVAAASRAWFPDILAGCYTPEELTEGWLLP